MSTTYLLKQLDTLFGGMLTYFLLPQKKTAVFSSPDSILIIRPGGIGDAVLLLPMLHQLATVYPDARIEVLAESRNAEVFLWSPIVSRIWQYDRPLDFLRLFRQRYDLIIDTEQWHRLSAVVARLVRSPMKIGFGTNERSRMFTHSVPYFHDDYEMASFCRLLEPLTGTCSLPDAISPFLSIPSDVVHLVAKLLAPLGDQQIVVIFPGASIAERRWGAARFKAVAELLQQKGYGVVVVGGADDLHDGLAIAGDCGLNLAGKTTLAETAAVLARAGLLISGDSGVLHIAVGLGIPTVSLFGPGRALKWAPRCDHHTVLNKGLPCSPCTTFGTTPPCPHKARCIQEITVAEVVNAAIALLQKKTGATD